MKKQINFFETDIKNIMSFNSQDTQDYIFYLIAFNICVACRKVFNPDMYAKNQDINHDDLLYGDGKVNKIIKIIEQITREK
jgi:hypothetical protein